MKIDQSFVRGLPNDPGAVAIVRSLITLSRGLKLDVIAEGIETEEQRSALLKLGCRCGQGFLFSRALSFDGFEQRSEEHTSELQSLMRVSYAVFCLKQTNTDKLYVENLLTSVATSVQDCIYSDSQF